MWFKILKSYTLLRILDFCTAWWPQVVWLKVSSVLQGEHPFGQDKNIKYIYNLVSEVLCHFHHIFWSRQVNAQQRISWLSLRIHMNFRIFFYLCKKYCGILIGIVLCLWIDLEIINILTSILSICEPEMPFHLFVYLKKILSEIFCSL